MTARWNRVAVGGVLALAACGDSGSAHQVPGAATEYAGVSLERAEELSASEGAAGGTAAFAQSCARRLRDPRDGREFLLMHSEIRTSAAKEGNTKVVVQLEHATGDYAPMSDAARGHSAPNLRVDCVSSHAVGWVAAGG
jgi:hypothetical protein